MNKKERLFTDSVDAMVWAEAFEEHKQRNNWTIDDIDVDLMVSWFANAMMRMSDYKDTKMERLKEENENLHAAIHRKDTETIGWNNRVALLEQEVEWLRKEMYSTEVMHPWYLDETTPEGGEVES